MAFIPQDMRAAGEVLQSPFEAAEQTVGALVSSQQVISEMTGNTGFLDPRDVHMTVSGTDDQEELKIKMSVDNVASIGALQVAEAVQHALDQVPLVSENFRVPSHHTSVSKVKQELEQLIKSQPDLSDNQQANNIISWQGFNDKGNEGFSNHNMPRCSVEEDDKNRVNFSVNIPKDQKDLSLKEITKNVDLRKDAIKQAVFDEAKKHKELQGLSLDDTELLIGDTDSEWSKSVTLTFGVKNEDTKTTGSDDLEKDDLTKTPLAQLDHDTLQSIISNAVAKVGAYAGKTYGHLADENIVKADIEQLFAGKGQDSAVGDILGDELFHKRDISKSDPQIDIHVGRTAKNSALADENTIEASIRVPSNMKATDFIKAIEAHGQQLMQPPQLPNMQVQQPMQHDNQIVTSMRTQLG